MSGSDQSPVEVSAPADPDLAFERLLDYLKEVRAFDFTGYKRASLMRRVQHHMQSVGIAGFEEYQDYLQVHPAEFAALFNTILINVTAFLRDPDAWQTLADEVVPALLEQLGDQPIRLWSAGCAAGQEAYSLAIVFAEMLGIEEFRSRAKIYATDVDEEALTYARLATYTERELTGLTQPYREKYFEANAGRFQFRRDLRRKVIFGRNDLVRDSPISKIDLLACRNTLMYLNAETQARIVSRLAFALRPQGILFLGKAEMLLNHSAAFEPVDLKRRFFRKRVNALIDAPADPQLPAPPAPGSGQAQELPQLVSEGFLSGSVGQLLLDRAGLVRSVSQAATELFDISALDVGRSFHDLEVSYRPAELRSHLEETLRSRVPVILRGVEWRRGNRPVVFLDIKLTPLFSSAGRPLGVLLSFDDVSRVRRLSDELQAANRDLETAYEELQSTNDELQSINDILRERTDEVTSLNQFMQSIVGSFGAAVVVLDSNLTVRLWTRQAEELWGLRADETVGQHFLQLDSGLPTEQLTVLVHEVASGAAERRELLIDAINRRGRPIRLRIVVTMLSEAGERPDGALVIMEAIDAPPEH